MRKMLEGLTEKIKRSDADYLDLRLEEKSGVDFSIKKSEVENIAETESIGYGIRALYKGRWGFTSANDISKISEKIDEAITFAKLAGNSKSQFHKVDPINDTVSSPMKIDPTKIPLDNKISLFLNYYKIISNFDKRIQGSSSLRYKDQEVKKYFLNSQGSFIEQEARRIGYTVNVITRENDNIQGAYTANSSLQDEQIIYKLEKDIKESCKIALDLLGAKPVKAGVYTVVANPELTGVFAHEAFGHLSEADYLYKDKDMQKIMKLGRSFGKPILNIVDDSALKGSYGTYAYDDDGVPTQKTYLIKKGKLVGRLHSRETAGLMREKPTGNARAINYRYMPIVRMTNTYIENGKTTFEDIIKDIKIGVYAVGALGGQTNTDNFVFGSQYGYMIRDGKVAELVKDVRLSGNVFETLKNIDMVGNDFELSSSLGGCGKGGQSPLPISHGGPHIRIQNVVIGGK